MQIMRWIRHLFSGRRQVQKVFPVPVLQDIEQAVRQGERQHGGELRVALEAGLSAAELWADRRGRDRAIELFSQLRLWDTEQNNGVLIYVLLADHDVEIVADRGLNERVTAAQWQAICSQMEQAFRAGDFRAGVLMGIDSVHQQLQRHFPADRAPRGAGLPDSPVVL